VPQLPKGCSSRPAQSAVPYGTVLEVDLKHLLHLVNGKEDRKYRQTDIQPTTVTLQVGNCFRWSELPVIRTSAHPMEMRTAESIDVKKRKDNPEFPQHVQY
jgi:hypothetical protein